MNNLEVFKNYYKEEKNNLDKIINNYNEQLIKEDNSIIKDNLLLFRNLNCNGKLVRGILVNLGYYLLKDNKEYSNSLSLAYELFQTGILIHDDVIDNDNKRRGVDTIHYSNYNKYKEYSDDLSEVKHLSNSIGICMGDYGLYLSNKVISDNYKNDSNLGNVLSYFNETVINTIRGELLDVVLPFSSKNNIIKEDKLEEHIMEIYKLKTSYYTIIGPMVCGLLLAGASNNNIKDVESFGEKIGIAFQIQDDILGIYSDEMGKVKGSDIKEYKQTLLFSHAMNTEYKDKLLKYYGKNELNEDIIDKVRKILIDSNSLKYAEDLMNKLYDESIIEIDNIKWIDNNKKILLKGFIEYLRGRNK